MSRHYHRGDQYTDIDALIYGVGTPELIQSRIDAFHERRKLALRVPDPEVSKRNLAVLADCMAGRSTKLVFEVTNHG